MMHRLIPLMFLAAASACDSRVIETDGGSSMDATAPRDAGHDAGSALPDDSGLPRSDSGPSCGAAQHLCDGVCTSPMANEPANGCRLGCGEPCPGGADAICSEEGLCSLRGCVPMTCEEMSVECGTTDNGCGARIGCGTCAGSLRCESGACVCDGDVHESNDTSATATVLGTLTDDPDSSVSVTNAMVHRSDDLDWFQVNVQNTGFLGPPEVTVELSGIPAGEDYDLGAWYVCPDGSTPGPCTSGSADGSVGNGGCVSSRVGADSVAFDTNCGPDGVLLIRVMPFAWSGHCGTYVLDVAIN